jgi:hypothetical protein
MTNITNYTIEQLYQAHLNNPSDINEHLANLRKLAEECDHVTEMGARAGASTFALLSAKCNKFVTYDIVIQEAIISAKIMANNENINFEYVEKNVLDVEIEETDFLFIDTWHKYGQLKEELRLHAKNVRKYIGFHDTESYEFVDEPGWNGLYNDVRPLPTEKQGIWPAIQEFLDENPDWKIKHRWKNNNGVTIIERQS